MSEEDNGETQEDLQEHLRERYGDSLAEDILQVKAEEKMRQRDLEKLNPKIRGVLGRVQVGITRVSRDEISYYMDQEECRKIYDLVKSDFEDQLTRETGDIYRQNRQPAVEHAEELIERTKRELFEDKYDQIRKMERSDRDDADKILERIKEPFQNPAKEELWEQLEEIEHRRTMLLTAPYGPKETSIEVPTIGGDPDFIYKLFAVWIYKPGLWAALFQFEDDFEEFPLKWLTHLPLPTMRYLYNEFKNGNIRDEVIVQEVDQEGYLEQLERAVEKLPPLEERTRITSEIVENYRDGRYASSINLVLPQIEFLMWIYASFVHKYSLDDVFVDAEYEDFWEFNTETHSDLSLKNSNGTTNDRLRVRALVVDTDFNKYLNPSIAEYFNEELFEERNPILHGSIHDYDSKLNAAKKILFFRNLIQFITNQMVRTGTEQIEISE
jgi:hypothetical protein